MEEQGVGSKKEEQGSWKGDEEVISIMMEHSCFLLILNLGIRVQ